MVRKGFRRVTPEQSRAATTNALRGLRDEAVRVAKNALADDDWKAALEYLWRAQDYDRRADAMELGEAPPVNRLAPPVPIDPLDPDFLEGLAKGYTVRRAAVSAGASPITAQS